MTGASATHIRLQPCSKKRSIAQPRRTTPLTPKQTQTKAQKVKVPQDRACTDQDNGDEVEDAMSTSFLQFCANCEKQIIVPDSSILYCSESCRRYDSSHRHSLSNLKRNSLTPKSSSSSSDGSTLPSHDIIPQRVPTGHVQQPIFTLQDTSESHSSSVESVQSRSPARERPSTPRADSEAARYLQQFQSKSRETSRRSSSSLSTPTNTPSLSHTPISLSTTSAPYTPHTSLGYVLHQSLPQRTNPAANNSSHKRRSVDLVIPSSECYGDPSTQAVITDHETVPPRDLKGSPTCAKANHGLIEGELLSYQKRSPTPTISSGCGSLKQLFDSQDIRTS